VTRSLSNRATPRASSALRLGHLLTAVALGLLLASSTPAYANHVAQLSGGVDVRCDGPSAEYRAEVRNAGTRNVVLTHALLYVYTHEEGKASWNEPTVANLLETAEATSTDPAQFDFILSPDEQKGQAAMLSLVPGVDRVAAILWVHVEGEPFWRIALDIDRCR
jgi:hypothetical protein